MGGGTMTTGTNAFTVNIKDGEPSFPCWCGIEHGGEYGLEDWMHHHCTHQELVLVPIELNDYQAICGLCGHTMEGVVADDA
jgi:hypothetical protein